jgi:hypothetical protein
MTITYPGGGVREGDLKPVECDDVVRAVFSSGEVHTFTRMQSVWFSEACEPVTIMFDSVIRV